MYIVEVAPLGVLPMEGKTLTYYSPTSLEAGDWILVSLRRRILDAIVLKTVPLAQQKIALKKLANFSLKKVGELKRRRAVSNLQLALSRWLSDYYHAPLGLCLKAVLPAFWRTEKYALPVLNKNILTAYTPPTPQWIPDTLKEYRKVLKHYTPKQILVVTPQKNSAVLLQKKLDPGGQNSALLYSGMNYKQLHVTHYHIQQNRVKVIFGTRSALFAPFSNLGCILLHRAADEAYYADKTPKYFTPDAAYAVAGMHNAQLFYSGLPLLELTPAERN